MQELSTTPSREYFNKKKSKAELTCISLALLTSPHQGPNRLDMYEVMRILKEAKIYDLEPYWFNHYFNDEQWATKNAYSWLKHLEQDESTSFFTKMKKHLENREKEEYDKPLPDVDPTGLYPKTGRDLFEKERWKCYMMLNHLRLKVGINQIDYEWDSCEDLEREIYNTLCEQTFRTDTDDTIVDFIDEETTPAMLCPTLDPDTLMNVFSYIFPFKVLQYRLVCQYWDQVATCNSMWRPYYYYYMGVREDTADNMLHHLVHAFKTMPRVANPGIYTPTTHFSMSSGCLTSRVNYSYIDVKDTEVTYQTHKLAVILSVLNTSNYVPRAKHLMNVGYTHDYVHMPLSAFMLAVLNNREVDLFPIDPQVEAKNIVVKPNEYNYQNSAMQDRPKLYSVAIGPHVGGEFVPFVYYTHLEGRLKTLSDIQSNTHRHFCYEHQKPLEINMEMVGNESDIDSIYEWNSDERGWAPGFWNAGFQWFYYVDFVSFYDKAKQQIVVAKVESHEGVY